jgi:hypothetical protein
MLLIPRIDFSGDLSLDAYTFNSVEIDAIVFVLIKSKINIVNEGLTQDSEGRYGLRFFILKIEISKLEETLNIKFERTGNDTKVIFREVFFNFDGGGPSSYKCSRIPQPV